MIRRKKGVLIEIIKIIQRLEEVDLEVKIGNGPGLSHMYQIVRGNCGKCPLRSDSLPNRHVSTWNIDKMII